MRGRTDDETGMVADVRSRLEVGDAPSPELEGVAVCVTASVVVETGRIAGNKLGVGRM